jgi:WG containing repeat
LKPLKTVVQVVYVVLVFLRVGLAQGEIAQPRTLFLVEVNSKWGYIDRTGKVVIEPIYYKAEEFSEGLAAVEIARSKRDAGFEYIDATGKTIIPPPEFYGMARFSEGMAWVKLRAGQRLTYGFLERTGKVVITPQIRQAGDFHEGLAFASFKGSYWNCDWGELSGILPCTLDLDRRGFIDQTGRYVIPIQFLSADDFSEGLAAVKVGRHDWTYIDKTGKRVMPKDFTAAGKFSEGLAPVAVKDFWNAGRVGFIDKTGRVVIPPQFDKARPFADGLARVEIGGKWGYVDKTGKMVIPAKFDLAEDFSEGLAAVNIGATESAKTAKEEQSYHSEAWPREMHRVRGSWPGDFSPDNPSCLSPRHTDYKREVEPGDPLGGAWGYIDRSGHMVIEPQFSAALGFSGGLAQVFPPGPCPADYDSGDVHVRSRFRRHTPWSHGIGYIDRTGKYVWKSAP